MIFVHHMYPFVSVLQSFQVLVMLKQFCFHMTSSKPLFNSFSVFSTYFILDKFFLLYTLIFKFGIL